MKISTESIKSLISILGFKLQEGGKEVYYKEYPNHKNYVLKIDFEQKKIDYDDTKIKLGDLTTSNFENGENFVVLECVDRVLEKGYAPDKISLEHKWKMGRKEKGKLDVLVMDNNDKVYLMIECKTWGDEYEKEKKKMQQDGGQLFSYFQQDNAAQYLCLYASRVIDGKIEFTNNIVKVDEYWKELSNQKEIFNHWNKNFKDNGIFEDWANAYDIKIKSLTKGSLKELTEEDSGWIYNQFAEILRHNVVSDKPNAFNKIFNLFLCKIVDEDRESDEELKFQWLENDTNEDLQSRLSDLYKQGMKEYLTKEVTDYNDEQVEEKLYALKQEERDKIREMFTRVRLHKNNEFAFKEVFDEKSFEENAIVVREVVELLQPYKIRYGHKQQFLGDFFELLLSTGIKQEAGQFFTPVPIAKFIISSLPLHELIKRKIENRETHFLPYIIDYAAGSGHFLTESMDEVQNIINKIDASKQRPSVKQNLNSWKSDPFNWAHDFVYGIEADYRLVKTAKVSCFLNGDGLANVIHADGLDHFQKSIDYKGKLKKIRKEKSKDNGVFDVLIANPPYSVSAFKNTLKNAKESFDLFNRLTDDSSEIECLFIERTKQLLKPGGWAGIILPNSILSNSGIYTDAREIILKYFDIKAIAEFGSNTFMATDTHTVTLFLERRANNDWKKVETAIKNFFDKPKEATINSIKKAFSKYVGEVFEDITLQDYISLVNKNPNEVISKTELFTDYKSWFNDLTEIKNIKTKKAFKDKSKDEQQSELDKLFYEKVFTKEQDKMLYFFLAQPQQTVLIKAGEKQSEKDFIGYEFRTRRGHEGIKIYRDKNGTPTTKLYDNENHLNKEKASSYVYHAFLGKQKDISESLQNNLTTLDLTKLMDFKKRAFEKSIFLDIKKKVDYKKLWKTDRIFPLSQISTIQKGSSITKDKTVEGSIPVVAGGQDLAYFHNASNRNANVITVSASGAYSGFLNYWEQPIFASDCNTIISKDENMISTKLIFEFLKSIQSDFYSLQRGQAQPHVYASDIEKVKIPLPPKSVQEQIVAKCVDIDQKVGKAQKTIKRTRNEIEKKIKKIDGNIKLKKIAQINPSKTELKDLPLDTVMTFVEMASVSNDGYIKKMIKKPYKNLRKGSYTYFAENDIIIAKITPCMENGKCALATGLTNALAMGSSEFHVIRATEKLEPKYLFIMLNRESVRKDAATKMTGSSGHRRVPASFYENIQIPVPSLSDQQKLIAKIEVLEQQISDAKKTIESAPQKKRQILDTYLK